jgi:hypothetical protein
VVLLFVIGVYWSPFEPHPPPADPSGAPSGTVSWPDEDWGVLVDAMAAARAAGADTASMGALMVEIGRSWVGVPRSAGVKQPTERLDVDLRRFDELGFVEHVYALAVVAKLGAASAASIDRAQVESQYERVLQTVRYRNGVMDGYGSRLLYVSEWVSDNDRKGLVEDLTRELGGVVEREPLDARSLRLAEDPTVTDPDVVEDVRRVEARLSGQARYVLREPALSSALGEIRDGDVIAVTSAVQGLDVSHVGVAVHVDGTVRLLHRSPGVGGVGISETPIDQRITASPDEDGLILARPVAPRPAGAGSAPEP